MKIKRIIRVLFRVLFFPLRLIGNRLKFIKRIGFFFSPVRIFKRTRAVTRLIINKRKDKEFLILCAGVILAFVLLRLVDASLYRRLYPVVKTKTTYVQKNWDKKIYRSIWARFKKKKEKEKEEAKKSFSREMAPLISCAYTKNIPVIDSQFDDCWKQSQLATHFINPKEFRLSRVNTLVYSLYNDKNIYFYFFCAEPYSKKIRARVKGPDSELSDNDSAEILLAIPAEKGEFSYYRFAFDSNGTRYEAKEVSKDGTPAYDKSWQAEWNVACQRMKEGWSAEVSIPVKSLGIAGVKPQDAWGINFVRHRYPEENEDSYWFPLNEKVPASPNLFASLVFGETPLQARLLTAEYSDRESAGKATLELTNPFRTAARITLKITSFSVSGARGAEKKYAIVINGREEKKDNWDYELTSALKREGVHNVVATLLNDEEKVIYRDLIPVEFPLVNPVLSCNEVSEPPVIDGNLDDSAWTLSQVASNFAYYEGEKLAKVQTTGYAVHDDKNLYFALVAEEPYINELKVTTKDYDGNAWEDDCIEIFIDTVGDGNSFYHLISNIRDVHYDAYHPQVLNYNVKWNSAWQSKTSIGKDRWVMEVVIPLGDIRIGAKKKMVRLNLNRERYAHNEKEYSGWSCTYGGFHCPFRFGTLLFTENAPVIEILPVKEGGPISLQVKNLRKADTEFFVYVTSVIAGEGVTTNNYTVRLSGGGKKKFELSRPPKVPASVIIEAYFPNEKESFFRSVIKQ